MIYISFYSWMIPAAITAAGLFWAIYLIDDGPGYFSGISNLLALFPVSIVSTISWIIWAILK